jgi:large subunit ribosomal protein L35
VSGPEKSGHARPIYRFSAKFFGLIVEKLPFTKKEVEMPKMKTKSGAKKRFRLTANGKVRGSAAFLSHNLRRRSQKMKRQARGTMILCDADARIVKRFLPYA